MGRGVGSYHSRIGQRCRALAAAARFEQRKNQGCEVYGKLAAALPSAHNRILKQVRDTIEFSLVICWIGIPLKGFGLSTTTEDRSYLLICDLLSSRPSSLNGTH